MFKKLLLDGAQFDFMIEIFLRTTLMFLLILIVLRLSGRRGVRQLTLFEVAIILGLGSAAGDPMFQEDLPVIYGIVVLFSVIVFYKLITWLASKSDKVTHLLEGKAMVIVEEGMFSIEGNRNADFSQNEFFAELRNQSVEHLGQVRIALLEVDGSMSILKYDDANTRYGLPLFPNAHKAIDPHTVDPPYACMFCGHIATTLVVTEQACSRCHKDEWTKAINTKYIG
ncbi:MAG: DUF421 domain-containing protein [Sphingobacteriales bacterium]|nr:MAG: DUF421 domain-containing protein [Sphingobacteriales bacterium]